jgi:hypothetical protein
MPSRVYLVANRDGTDPRLIRAPYRHMAERHVAAQRFVSRIATKDDLVKLITAGVRVEDAGPAEAEAEPEAEAQG